MFSRRDFGQSAVIGVATWAASGAGALAAMAPATANAAPAQAAAAPTVSLNILYPSHAGAKFDLAYYRATHIPLAMKGMKATSVKLIEGVATPDGPAPFVMIAYFEFPSLEALQAAAASPGMAEVRADLANFTDIKPTIMIGRTV